MGKVVLVRPGAKAPVHFVQEPLRQVQHRVQDSLRCHSSRQVEARCTVTFAGLGDGADGAACCAALRVTSTELQQLLVRGLMAGALSTAARVLGHGTRTNSACPYCGAAHKDQIHVLWDCPEWEHARVTWRPWLCDAAAAILQLGPPNQWPACLWRAGLFPLRLAQGVQRELLVGLLYRLYGMYLAVLAAHMPPSRGGQAGQRDSMFADHRRLRPRNCFP